MKLLSKLFKFVVFTSNKFAIDESHGVTHSMNVLNYANNIYNSEVKQNPYLQNQERVILLSAMLHDMCDKKYVNEDEGMKMIQEYLHEKIPINEIDVIKNIITTISYSKVKISGYPDLGEYQLAYHIVRESDLLTAYDFDRCMIYKINKNNLEFDFAFDDAIKLFDIRVLKHLEDNLFVTEFSKNEAVRLHRGALERIESWKNIIKKFDDYEK